MTLPKRKQTSEHPCSSLLNGCLLKTDRAQEGPGPALLQPDTQRKSSIPETEIRVGSNKAERERVGLERLPEEAREWRPRDPER